MRWSLALSDFWYEVHYIKGSSNLAADAFSRNYDEACIQDKENEISINATTKDKSNKKLINMLKYLENLQKNDKYISSIIKKLDDGINENIKKKIYFKKQFTDENYG